MERAKTTVTSLWTDSTIRTLAWAARRPPLSGAPFPGNRIPTDRIHAAAAKVMAFYPRANRADQVNNYIADAADNDEWNSFLGKVDHRFSDADSISVRYMRRLNNTMNPFSANTFSSFANHTNVSQSLGGITYTRMFSPSLINEARAGVSRTTNRKTADTVGTDYASQIGIRGHADLGEIEAPVQVRRLFHAHPVLPAL